MTAPSELFEHLRLHVYGHELGHSTNRQRAVGRWPTQREWERGSSSHVTRRNYARNFGSWEEAFRAAARVKP